LFEEFREIGGEERGRVANAVDGGCFTDANPIEERRRESDFITEGGPAERVSPDDEGVRGAILKFPFDGEDLTGCGSGAESGRFFVVKHPGAGEDGRGGKDRQGCFGSSYGIGPGFREAEGVQRVGSVPAGFCGWAAEDDSVGADPLDDGERFVAGVGFRRAIGDGDLRFQAEAAHGESILEGGREVCTGDRIESDDQNFLHPEPPCCAGFLCGFCFRAKRGRPEGRQTIVSQGGSIAPDGKYHQVHLPGERGCWGLFLGVKE